MRAADSATARALALGLLLLACSAEERAVRGIQTRVFVDRAEARVGDPIGVTIEIEAPEGFRVDRPAPPPPDDRFLTEQLEPLEPLPAPGGLRHRLVWTLRARSTGEHRLPHVEVPLVFPDGRTEPLRVGGVPLPVLSVSDELPAQETYFDIEPAPAPELFTPVVLGALGALGVGAAGLVALVWVRRRRRELPEPDEHVLIREAIEAVERALGAGDAREIAAGLGAALYAFAGTRLGTEVASAVPEELESHVDPGLVELLRNVEQARFARATSRESALERARDARDYLRGLLPAGQEPRSGQEEPRSVVAS